MDETKKIVMGLALLSLSNLSFGGQLGDHLYGRLAGGQTTYGAPANGTWYQEGYDHNFDLKDSAKELALGFQLNKYVSAEIGYRKLGTAVITANWVSDEDYAAGLEANSLPAADHYGRHEYQVRGEFARFVFGYPIKKFTPYAGLGVFDFRLKSHTWAHRFDENKHVDWISTTQQFGRSSMYSIGSKYDVTNEISAVVDFTRYPDISITGIAANSAETIYVGFEVKF